MDSSYHVDLPTYAMLAATFEPITNALLHAHGPYPDADPKDVMALNPTVIVDVPDDCCDHTTQTISPEKIRALYSNVPRFAHPDWKAPN